MGNEWNRNGKAFTAQYSYEPNEIWMIRIELDFGDCLVRNRMPSTELGMVFRFACISRIKAGNEIREI